MLSRRVPIRNSNPVSDIRTAVVLHSSRRMLGADLADAIIPRPPEGLECLLRYTRGREVRRSAGNQAITICLFQLRPKSSKESGVRVNMLILFSLVVFRAAGGSAASLLAYSDAAHAAA